MEKMYLVWTLEDELHFQENSLVLKEGWDTAAPDLREMSLEWQHKHINLCDRRARSRFSSNLRDKCFLSHSTFTRVSQQRSLLRNIENVHDFFQRLVAFYHNICLLLEWVFFFIIIKRNYFYSIILRPLSLSLFYSLCRKRGERKKDLRKIFFFCFKPVS